MDNVHVHHWTIDAPNGPVSAGHCECGESRKFRNTLEDEFNREFDPERAGVQAQPVKTRLASFDYTSLPPLVSPRDSRRWRSLGVNGCYTLSSGGRSYD